MLPQTSRRVTDHSSDRINEQIRAKTEHNVREYADRGRIAIDKRLAELEEEWDIERTLETNAAALALIGLGLGMFVNKKFLILPVVVAGFLLQHGLQGWCPPLPFFRRQGIRTAGEIHAERYALKALRGDFEPVYDKSPHQKADHSKAFRAVMA